jgi:stage V sporulation protein B
MSVILGSSIGACLTLFCLVYLRMKEKAEAGEPIPVRSQLLQSAVPLALADVLKSGISTTENLMVPRRLVLNSNIANPLAAFGILSGMVFPVLMFPACILFGLAELLIPELARCAAAGSHRRIRYLVQKSLKVAMLYGLLAGGIMVLTGDSLCRRLYSKDDVGTVLKCYALLVPMLYCDAITDAMIKGLGQQTVCVRYNILTSAMDVAFLYILLPRYGMDGYFASFLITHLLNFLLSLRRLLKISGLRLPFHIPVLILSAALASLWLASTLSGNFLRCTAYLLLLFSSLILCGILRREDAAWVRRLVVLG